MSGPVQRVQYVRSYTTHELAELQVQVQKVFAEHPQLVCIAVLAQQLHRMLTHTVEGEPDIEPAPARVQALIDALDKGKGLFLRMCVEGLECDEVVS